MPNPYVNPYSTALPGLRESTTLTLQSIVQASIADLNAALNRDAQTPVTFTTAQVIVGAPMLPKQSLICIIGAGRDDAVDMEADYGFLAGGNDQFSYGELIYTEIRVMLKWDEMPGLDPIVQTQSRELCLQRICDHLRKRVFNSVQFATLTLGSQEHSVNPNFDQLLSCHVRQIKAMTMGVEFGQSQIYSMAQLVHSGCINTIEG